LHPFSYSYNPEKADGGMLDIKLSVNFAILVNYGVCACGGAVAKPLVGFGMGGYGATCLFWKNFCLAWEDFVGYMGM
jgi:hypothetical protein